MPSESNRTSSHHIWIYVVYLLPKVESQGWKRKRRRVLDSCGGVVVVLLTYSVLILRLPGDIDMNIE